MHCEYAQVNQDRDIFPISAATTYKLSCCWIQSLIVFSSENSPPCNVVVYTQAVDPIIRLIGRGMLNMTTLCKGLRLAGSIPLCLWFSI